MFGLGHFSFHCIAGPDELNKNSRLVGTVVVDSLVGSFLTHSVVALRVSLSLVVLSNPTPPPPFSLSLCFLSALCTIGINVKSKSKKR